MLYKSYLIEQNFSSLKSKITLFYGENTGLKKELKGLMFSEKIKTYVPKINYSTDNAAMIGINGYFKFIESKFGELSDFSVSKYPV